MKKLMLKKETLHRLDAEQANQIAAGTSLVDTWPHSHGSCNCSLQLNTTSWVINPTSNVSIVIIGH